MVGMKAIKLAPIPETIEAYECSIENMNDIFELLGAKKVASAIKNHAGKSRFDIVLYYHMEDGSVLEMQVADTPFPGDYLVNIEGEFKVFTAEQLSKNFTKI